MSLSDDALTPVIAIERPDIQTGNDSAIQQPVSLSVRVSLIFHYFPIFISHISLL